MSWYVVIIYVQKIIHMCHSYKTIFNDIFFIDWITFYTQITCCAY